MDDFNKAINLNSSVPKYFYNRGLAKYYLREEKGAIYDFDEAIKLDPQFIEAHNEKAFLMRFLNPQEALYIIEKAKFINSNCAKTYHYSGEINNVLKNYEEAILDYLKAISLSPFMIDAYIRIASIKIHFTEDYLGAIDILNQLILKKPINNAYSLRGLAKYNLGNYQEALEDYNVCLNKNDKDVNTLKKIISIKGHLNTDYNDILKDLNKIIELSDSDWEVYIKRGLIRELYKDYQGAKEDFDKAIALFSFVKTCNYPPIQFDFDNFINIEKDNDELYFQRGIKKYQIELYKTALDDLNKAININPKNYWALKYRALIKEDFKEYQDALEDCKKALKLNPNDPDVYSFRSKIKRKLNDIEGAEEDLKILEQLRKE